MMDDIAEQQDVAKEISDAISNPVAFGQDIDEEELERELEELEQVISYEIKNLISINKISQIFKQSQNFFYCYNVHRLCINKYTYIVFTNFLS